MAYVRKRFHVIMPYEFKIPSVNVITRQEASTKEGHRNYSYEKNLEGMMKAIKFTGVIAVLDNWYANEIELKMAFLSRKNIPFEISRIEYFFKNGDLLRRHVIKMPKKYYNAILKEHKLKASNWWNVNDAGHRASSYTRPEKKTDNNFETFKHNLENLRNVLLEKSYNYMRD